jgi:hypothetical protein
MGGDLPILQPKKSGDDFIRPSRPIMETVGYRQPLELPILTPTGSRPDGPSGAAHTAAT